MKINIKQAVDMAKSDPDSEFANKLRRTIDSGSLDKSAFDQGFDLSKFGRPAYKPEIKQGLGYRLRDIPQDIQKTGQNISQSFNNGIDRINEAQSKTINGEQSLASGTFQTIGEGLKTGASIIGDLFVGGASLATTADEEEAIQRKLVEGAEALGKTDVGQGVAELAEQYNTFKESNPEIAANLEASLGFAEAVLEITGAGAGLKAAKKAGQATGKAAKKAGMVINDITPDFQKLVPDLSPQQITDSGLSKKEILAGIRPDVKKSIVGQESGIKEYFDVTRKRLEDETAKTPTGLLTEKAENAFKEVEKQLSHTGSGIGAKREKLGSVKASDTQTKELINALDSELRSMGLTTTKTGGVKKGKGIVDVSDAELKLIAELKSDLLKVRGDAKVSTIQKAVNKFRNRVNFGKSSQEISGVMDGLLKKVSGKASDINKSILGKEAAAQYSKYGEIADFLKETKGVRKNPQVILRRILSADSSKGLQFAETIKELTGVDLIKESRFAKLAVDTFGEVNPELGTRFRQQLTDSGVSAGNILAKAGGKAGAIGTVLELVRDIPKAAKREFLLRKGINPAQIDADELAEIILESARGSQKKAADIVEEVVKTKGKTDVGLGKKSSIIDDTFLDTDKIVKDLGKRIKDTPNKQGGFVKNPLSEDSLFEQAKKFDTVDDFKKFISSPPNARSQYYNDVVDTDKLNKFIESLDVRTDTIPKGKGKGDAYNRNNWNIVNYRSVDGADNVDVYFPEGLTEEIKLYRGTKNKSAGKRELRDGEFLTADKSIAKKYGDNVQEYIVKSSDILLDPRETGVWKYSQPEFNVVYNPNHNLAGVENYLKNNNIELTDIFNQAKNTN